MNVDNTQDITVLSLCSGYGGIELGLKRACPNVRTIAYVEVEAFACANLVAKMEQGLLDVAPIWTDIKTFDAEPFCNRVHIITAGYPCQPFSVAGKRQGTDDPRHLWPHIDRIIEAVRPVWFFGENVSGHLTIGFPEVYRSLRNLGYSVEAGIFSAAECGAPHRRERLFILAYSEHNGHFTRKEPRSISSTICNTEKGQDNPRNPQRTSKSSKLADTECARTGQGNIKETQGGIRRVGLAIDSRVMADTTTQRIQRPEPERATQAGRQTDQQGTKWPARPGQPQYEWEEPRVVEQSNSRRLEGANTKRPRRNNVVCASRKNKGQAQSRLGRAVDGTNCRVDRLRLLGNGVVPQQVEKAFKYLIRKF